MKVIKAIYNFIVGDMIILIGTAIAIAILALINGVSALAPLRIASGTILVVSILIILVATLSREARANK